MRGVGFEALALHQSSSWARGFALPPDDGAFESKLEAGKTPKKKARGSPPRAFIFFSAELVSYETAPDTIAEWALRLRDQADSFEDGSIGRSLP